MKALLAKQKMINKVILIPEYKIKPNPYQPRKVFDDEKIDSWQPALHSTVCFSQSQCFRWRMETISWLQEKEDCLPAENCACRKFQRF